MHNEPGWTTDGAGDGYWAPYAPRFSSACSTLVRMNFSVKESQRSAAQVGQAGWETPPGGAETWGASAGKTVTFQTR